MCQAPNHIKVPQGPQLTMQYQHRRQRRLAQIVRMLRTSSQPTPTTPCPLNKLAFAALSIKLERLIYRVLPANTGILSDELLELRMRRVIHHILDAKNVPVPLGMPPSEPTGVVVML
ncbi:hypothetical protein H257_08975 [Aphanomyces astaci]|nr:hypothetical protein H257_08975 [Aphanomyces astaci]ETV77067.1 hypothetical protein H257_08975 [Aphanomyces astaci]RHY04984.1 hypothetical protein DYB36_010338 [Aphanomyces astaci]RLO03535.1 hypothetical protein DYB28_008050 [Aphanomyces astaci]RQM25032.1 hypothetical protein B5M09_004706 [Aphanomyces astaci]|eukprot:XP_009833373.1 hypothetical protein H257_08975 [Aphanomyces astaci]